MVELVYLYVDERGRTQEKVFRGLTEDYAEAQREAFERRLKPNEDLQFVRLVRK